MELGRYLVRELDFEDGVDTLGRWMAHHLAELINQVENGPTATERSKARQNAKETILRIWEHRASLPGKVYPLSSFRNVLVVIDRLRPDKNPFWSFKHRSGTKLDQLTASLFDVHSRLIIALLLMKLAPTEKAVVSDIDPVAIEALDETEQLVLSTLTQWLQLFESKSGIYVQVREEREEEPEHEADTEKIALELIDELTNTLQELRGEIGDNR